jgi:hypothetical protein
MNRTRDSHCRGRNKSARGPRLPAGARVPQQRAGQHTSIQQLQEWPSRGRCAALSEVRGQRCSALLLSFLNFPCSFRRQQAGFLLPRHRGSSCPHDTPAGCSSTGPTWPGLTLRGLLLRRHSCTAGSATLTRGLGHAGKASTLVVGKLGCLLFPDFCGKRAAQLQYLQGAPSWPPAGSRAAVTSWAPLPAAQHAMSVLLWSGTC